MNNKLDKNKHVDTSHRGMPQKKSSVKMVAAGCKRPVLQHSQVCATVEETTTIDDCQDNICAKSSF